MIVSNPLLNMSEFLEQGFSRNTHNGALVRLGAGRNRALGWSSPVEINFSETTNGRSTRGSIALNRFYVAKQDLINEKLWYWTPNRNSIGGQAGSWSLERSSGNASDDPDPMLISYNTQRAEVSFLDSPGFPVQHFFNIDQTVQRVYLVQNFRQWIEVNRTFSSGTFQAANDVLWHHCLGLLKAGSRWTVVTNQSLLGRGELRLSSPMWS